MAMVRGVEPVSHDTLFVNRPDQQIRTAPRSLLTVARPRSAGSSCSARGAGFWYRVKRAGFKLHSCLPAFHSRA